MQWNEPNKMNKALELQWTSYCPHVQLGEDESFHFKSNTTLNHGDSVPFNSLFPVVCLGNEVRLSFFLRPSSESSI